MAAYLNNLFIEFLAENSMKSEPDPVRRCYSVWSRVQKCFTDKMVPFVYVPKRIFSYVIEDTKIYVWTHDAQFILEEFDVADPRCFEKIIEYACRENTYDQGGNDV